MTTTDAAPTTRPMTLDAAEALALAALRGAGASAEQAAPLARAVRAAEADGIASHGLAYVPTYCEHVACGKVDGTAVPTVSGERPGAIRVDAGNGFAHAAIDAAFEALVPAVRELGVAAATIRESYNCGVLGHHVERLAEIGLLALGFTNAPASIAPVGGRTPVIGTNPVALAVPDGAGAAAILIDQSASVVAKSEIMMRARAGEAIPAEWARDADGEPTTDPSKALEGSMAPAGGHKGFGAGLMTEVFAAALAGAVLGKDASPFSGTAGGPPRTGQCFVAFDPTAFSGAVFAERIDALVAAIEAEEGSRVPGARRRAARARTVADGIAPAEALVRRIEAWRA